MRLSDCFLDLIVYVAYTMNKKPHIHLSYDHFRNETQRLISDSEICYKNYAYSQEEYQLARFAVFAWIDETVLSSSWENKGPWQSEKLQFEFKTADAGELFFEKLNKLSPLDPKHQNVREIYYLCLSLGFMGKYINDQDGPLIDSLKTQNLKVLTGSSAGIPSIHKEQLFEKAYPQTENVEMQSQNRFQMPLFVTLCIALPAGLVIILFFVFRFVLNLELDKLLN